MLEMPKGFWPRFAAICAGSILVPILAKIAALSSHDRGMVEFIYLLVVMGYLLYFLLKHEDEIPTREG